VGENYVILLGQVRKPVNTNQGLKVNQGNNFSSMKMLSSTMFCVVWEYLCSKLESNKYKLNTWLKSYKNEIKILANPGLALLGFEHTSPGYQYRAAVYSSAEGDNLWDRPRQGKRAMLPVVGVLVMR